MCVCVRKRERGERREKEGEREERERVCVVSCEKGGDRRQRKEKG